MLSLSQEGRAGLQLLGNLQEYTSSKLRERVHEDFYSDAEMAAIGDQPIGKRGAEAEDAIAQKAAAVADGIQTHRFERFYQRIVAEDVYNRGIPAAEELRPKAGAFLAPPTDLPDGVDLTLNPDLDLPESFKDVEWHLMPGGWEGYDMSGVMFMAGVSPFIFARGGYAAVQPRADIMNQRQRYLDQLPDDIDYHRFFDFGSAGSGLLGMVHKRYPDAKLAGCDLSASLLKGGAKMAAMMGFDVQLKQESASATSEPDNHYDAALSYAVLHEMDDQITYDSLKEMYRILKPGGVLLISDPGPLRALNPYQAVLYDWETEHREEPHFSASIRRDLPAWMAEIGYVNCEEYGIDGENYPWITRGRKPE